MDSATKTVGGVDIVWMGLTFDVLELKKYRYGWCTTYILRREFTVSEHAYAF